MYFSEELDPFSASLREAATDPDLPRRARAALKAVALYRTRQGHRHVSQTEKRMLSSLPMIRAQAMDVEVILDLARKILTGEST
jgi:hypothetical protein